MGPRESKADLRSRAENAERRVAELKAEREAAAKLRAEQEASKLKTMEEEMKKSKKQWEHDKQAQEKVMEHLRTEHSKKIAKMDEDRAKYREQFDSQISEMRKKSETAMKKMDLKDLDQRREIMLRELVGQRKSYLGYYDEYLGVAVEFSQLDACIIAEEKRLSKFMAVRHDPDCLRMMLFGATGHGKSSLACRLSGDRTRDFSDGGFTVSGAIESVTQSIKGLVVDPADPKVKHLKYKTKFLVIDMPGTGETRGADVGTQHSNRMIQYLKGVEFINCVALLRSGVEPRMTEGTKDMLKALVTAFGPEIWAHVVLIITKVPSDYSFSDEEDMIYERTQIDRWIDAFRGKIRTEFGVSESQSALTAIKIDNKDKRDYPEKCHAIIETQAKKYLKRPFHCDKLSSELDDWRHERVMKKDEINKQRDSVKKSATMVNALIDEINQIENELSSKSDGSITELKSKLALMGCDTTLMDKIDSDSVTEMIEAEQKKVYSTTFTSATKAYVVEDDDDCKYDDSGVGSSSSSSA